jgi:hypothetical protein
MRYTIKSLLLASVLLAATNVYGAVTLNKIEINPLNRGIMYLSELPKDIKSSISTDKKSITLRLAGVNFPEKINQINGSGIIKNISLSIAKKELIVILNLTDKRGYSIIHLPFTKAILVDVFDWNTISRADEDYRMGLLALESQNYKLASKFFENSIKLGNPYSSYQLGILYLRNGDYDKAIKIFQFAENKEITINDLYAAFAQAYKKLKNTSKENYYKKLFTTKTGINEITFITEEKIFGGDSLAFDNDSILNIFGDSTAIPNVTPINAKVNDTVSRAIAPPDPLLAKQNEEFNKKFINVQDQSQIDFITYIMYGFIFVCISLLVIIIAYFKWKNNKKLEMERREKAKKFTADLKNATNKYSPKPEVGKLLDKVVSDSQDEILLLEKSDTYNLTKMNQTKSKQEMKHQNIIDLAQEILKNKHDEEDANEIMIMPIKIQTPDSDPVPDFVNEPINGNNEDRINDIIDNITYITDNYDLEKALAKQKDINEDKFNKINDGKYDLALKLKDHETNRKLRELDKINLSSKLLNKKVIIEKARSHGIEKAGIEVKANLFSIENDKEKLAKLSKKFSYK